VDDFKERRGYSHVNEEALERTMWRAGIGIGFETVVKQTAKWMQESLESNTRYKQQALFHSCSESIFSRMYISQYTIRTSSISKKE
jgi:hypothetical protein